MNKATQELIDAIEDAGYAWREYSGRGMMGTQCVGIELEDDGELFQLGQSLSAFNMLGNPKTDSLGRNVIAYWPRAKIEPTDAA